MEELTGGAGRSRRVAGNLARGMVPELATVLRAALAHRDELLSMDPWLPIPQTSCTYRFGVGRHPLPIGAAFILWDRWAAFSPACSRCGAVARGYGFGGFLSVGWIPACCVECTGATLVRTGGIGGLREQAQAHLAGTPFEISGMKCGGCVSGGKRPLVAALQALGVTSLPGDAWLDASELEAASFRLGK